MSDTMKDDYLWDRCGEPDEILQHLESVLAEYRYAAASTQNDSQEDGRQALDEADV